MLRKQGRGRPTPLVLLANGSTFRRSAARAGCVRRWFDARGKAGSLRDGPAGVRGTEERHDDDRRDRRPGGDRPAAGPRARSRSGARPASGRGRRCRPGACRRAGGGVRDPARGGAARPPGGGRHRGGSGPRVGVRRDRGARDRRRAHPDRGLGRRAPAARGAGAASDEDRRTHHRADRGAARARRGARGGGGAGGERDPGDP